MKVMRQLLCPGGILGPARLEAFSRAALQFRVEELLIGPRQSLYALLEPASLPAFDEVTQPLGPVEGWHTNIMSDAPDLLDRNGTGWLSGSMLRGLLEARELSNGGDLALLNPAVGRPDFFPARVNVVAAEQSHHWQIILRGSFEAKLRVGDFLISSFALAEVLGRINSLGNLQAVPDEDILALAAGLSSPFEGEPARASSAPPSFGLEEGFTESPDGKLVLTLLAPDLGLPTAFFEELAYMMRRDETGRAYLTSDHRVRIAQIPREQVDDWRTMLHRHGVRLRHDDHDFGWRCDLEQRGFLRAIKRTLRKQQALREGQIWAVGLPHLGEGAQILIQPASGWGRRHRLLVRSGQRPLPWRVGAVARTATGLIKEFLAGKAAHTQPETNDATDPRGLTATYQSGTQTVGDFSIHESNSTLVCPECMSIYEPAHGDLRAGVSAGTPIAQLPEDYVCAVCEHPFDIAVTMASDELKRTAEDLVPAMGTKGANK